MLKSPGDDAARTSRSRLTVVCADWRPHHKNTLCGFALIRIAELGLKIHNVTVHRKGASMWAALPARPWTDDNGRTQYSVILEFDRKEVRDAFSRAVIDAVIRFEPNALKLEEGVA